MRLWADTLALLVVEQAVDVAHGVVGGGGRGAVADVVGCVVVHAVEVVGAQDKGLLLGCKCWQAISELSAHRRRIISQVDRVGKPRREKFQSALSRLPIGWVRRIPGISEVAVEDDADLAIAGSLELLSIGLYGTAVGNQEVVADRPGL